MRARTRILIAGAAVLALAAAGTGAWWMTRTPSVQDAATQYLHALAGGDLATIRGMIPDTLPGAQRTRILDAFAGATSHISDPRLEGTVASDGGVRAHARLDGRDVVLFFMLGRADGRWVLTGDFLGSLTVRPTLGGAVTVGGVELAAGAPLSLLPAVYPVRAAPETVLQGVQDVPVGNETPVTLTLHTTLAPTAVAAAEAQLTAYEDACTRSAPAVPAHCGLRVPWAADLRTLTGLTFRIQTRPTLTLAADGRSFAATGGDVVATAHGTTWGGTPGVFSYRADDWALRGTVVFEQATMQLAVG